MARAFAIALVALLACSLVAEISAQATFCRTSSYKLPSSQVLAAKQKMYANCAANVKVLSYKDVNGCAEVVQQVANEAAWTAYSNCEKSAQNAAIYAPLKAASSACSANQKQGACA